MSLMSLNIEGDIIDFNSFKGAKYVIIFLLLILFFEIGFSLNFNSGLTYEDLDISYEINDNIQIYDNFSGKWKNTYLINIEDMEKKEVDENVYLVEINISKTELGKEIYKNIEKLNQENLTVCVDDELNIEDYKVRGKNISSNSFEYIKREVNNLSINQKRAEEFEVKNIPSEMNFNRDAEIKRDSKTNNNLLRIKLKILDTEDPVKASWEVGNSITFRIEEKLGNTSSNFAFTDNHLVTTFNDLQGERDEWLLAYNKNNWTISEKERIQTYSAYDLDVDRKNRYIVIGMYVAYPADVRPNLRVFSAPDGISELSTYTMRSVNVDVVGAGENITGAGGFIREGDPGEDSIVAELPGLSIKNTWDENSMGEEGSSISLNDVEVDPNDSLIAWWDRNDILSIWELENYSKEREWGEGPGYPKIPEEWEIEKLRFSPDSKYLAIGSHVLNVKEEYEEVAEFNESGYPLWSPRQKYLAIAHGNISIYETDNWTKKGTIEDGGKKAEWSNCGEFIVNERGNVYRRTSFNIENIKVSNITNQSADIKGNISIENSKEIKIDLYWRKEHSEWKNISIKEINESKNFNQSLNDLEPNSFYEFFLKIESENEKPIKLEKSSFRTKTTPGIWRKETGSDWRFWSEFKDNIDVKNNSIEPLKAKSLMFNNDSDYVVSEPLNFSEEKTISMWVHFQNSSFNQSIMAIERNDTGLNKSKLALNEEELFFKINHNKSNFSMKIKTEEYLKNDWNHIIVSISKNKSKLYVNNYLKDYNKSKITNNYLNNSKVYIGNYKNRSGDIFRGKIDDFRKFNKSLSKSEIEKLYNYKYKPINNEKIFWTMNRLKNQTIEDISKKGNHGKVSNSLELKESNISIGKWFSKYWYAGFSEEAEIKRFESKFNYSNHEETTNKIQNDSYDLGEIAVVQIGVDENNNTEIDSWSEWKGLEIGKNNISEKEINLTGGYGYKINYWLSSNISKDNYSFKINNHGFYVEVREDSSDDDSDDSSNDDSDSGSGSSGGSGGFSYPSYSEEPEEDLSEENETTDFEEFDEKYSDKEINRELRIISPRGKVNSSFKFEAKVVNDNHCYVKLNNKLWDKPDRDGKIISKEYKDLNSGNHIIEVQCNYLDDYRHFEVFSGKNESEIKEKEISKLTGSYINNWKDVSTVPFVLIAVFLTLFLFKNKAWVKSRVLQS